MTVEQDGRRVVITCDSEIEAGNLALALKNMLERGAKVKKAGA